MAFFYTIGNIKMETVELVARALREREPDVKIEKLVIFESKESEKLENDQIEIYRKYLGNFIKESIQMNEDGSIDSAKLLLTFDNDQEKIVDLSNGPKSSSSFLFMAASLCKVDRIYYLMLKGKPTENMVMGIDYEYIRMRQVDYVSKLAKISYFDLIYYTEEMQQLFTENEKKQRGPLKVIYDGLTHGIKAYFTGTDFRSVVNNVTIGNEKIVNSMLAYIQTDGECVRFCGQYGIRVTEGKDPIGILTYFARKYTENGGDTKILSMATCVSLLASLREYRNISAHYSQNQIEFTEDQTRIIINLSLEVIKCIRKNDDLWERIKRG